MSKPFDLNDLSLGKETDYVSDYLPSLLQAVPRSLNRESLGCVDSQPFFGEDVWHAYELSWLNLKGKPVVMLARFKLAFSTPNIIESKSFKLYLNSFNQSRFETPEAVTHLLEQDLSAVAGGPVSVELIEPDNIDMLAVTRLPGECIDDLDVEVKQYDLDLTLLKVLGGDSVVSETLHSHLLKSNCLITNQPDWASVVITYTGSPIDRAALLKYLISFRMHNEFHEQCVERLYCDILSICKPSALSVQALYTRRGGLDINPFRSSNPDQCAPLQRVNRQ